MITFRGSQEAVLNRLYGFLINELFSEDHAVLARVQQALADVQAGAWLVTVFSWVFEVVDPPMTVEQNVYGCACQRFAKNDPQTLSEN